MKRFLIILWLFVIVGTGRAQSVYTNLFVENSLGESVSRVDLTENRIWNDVFTTGNVPNQIKVKGDSLYILNSVSSTLQIVNLNTQKNVATIDLGTNKNPWNFAFCKSSGLIFVTNLMANSVSVVDIGKGAVVDSITVGQAPEGIVAVGKRVYVTNTAFDATTFSYGQGSVTVIDAASRSVVDSILTPINPQNLAVDAGGRIHVVCTGNFSTVPGSVLVVDLGSNSVLDTVVVGGTPSSITIAPNGVAYLGAGGWVTNGNVLAYNASTFEVLHGADNPIRTATGAMDVLADDAGHVFVAAFNEDRVDVIDTKADSVVDSYEVGDGPQSLALWKITASGVAEKSGSNRLPAQFVLEQNYPNPIRTNVRALTQFNFEIPRSENVTLKIYNVLGQVVATLVNGKLTAGTHQVQADLGYLSAGLYFSQLRTAQGVKTRKLVVKP